MDTKGCGNFLEDKICVEENQYEWNLGNNCQRWNLTSIWLSKISEENNSTIWGLHHVQWQS